MAVSALQLWVCVGSEGWGGVGGMMAAGLKGPRPWADR
jgi:hypothetical protein